MKTYTISKAQIEQVLKKYVVDSGYVSSRYAVIDTDSDDVEKHCFSFDEAVTSLLSMASAHPAKDLAITGWNHGILATARDVEKLFAPAEGTFACPICGDETPHQHDGNEVQEHTKSQIFWQKEDEKRRKEILRRVDNIEDRYGKTPKLDEAVALLQGLLAQPEPEPVATLHDDGYYTFKKGKKPYKSDFVGWKLDVFTRPPAAFVPITADMVTDAKVIEHAAQTLAKCMDFPWEHMIEKGRETMRMHARTIVLSAINAWGAKQ